MDDGGVGATGASEQQHQQHQQHQKQHQHQNQHQNQHQHQHQEQQQQNQQQQEQLQQQPAPTPEPVVSVDPSGTIVGGGAYRVERAIGKGKFAVVYKAVRLADGEVVALKRVSVGQMDERARAKALKEVRLVQSLSHPNVVRYYDSFLEGDQLVIALEWAAAGDLKRQLRKAQERHEPFEERVVWKYFSQIADAIGHMVSSF